MSRLALHAEFDRLDWIGRINLVMPRFVSLDQRQKDLEMLARFAGRIRLRCRSRARQSLARRSSRFPCGSDGCPRSGSLLADRGGVDRVVLGVCAHEFDVDRLELVGHRHDEAVVVALDVEHHPAIGQKAGRGKPALDVLLRLPAGLGGFVEPSFERLLRIRVSDPEFPQRLDGDDTRAGMPVPKWDWRFPRSTLSRGCRHVLCDQPVQRLTPGSKLIFADAATPDSVTAVTITSSLPVQSLGALPDSVPATGSNLTQAGKGVPSCSVTE